MVDGTVEDDPGAPFFNDTTKYVVSGTLDEGTWRNSEIIGPYDADRIRRLKDEVDGDIYISGSAMLVRALLADGLVDELHLFVYPLTLGPGTRLFDEKAPNKLALARSSRTQTASSTSRTGRSDVVGHDPARAGAGLGSDRRDLALRLAGRPPRARPAGARGRPNRGVVRDASRRAHPRHDGGERRRSRRGLRHGRRRRGRAGYVAAATSGTGVEDALIREAESQVLAGGHQKAWLAVVAGNARARAFYERAGWSDEGGFDYEAAVEGGTIAVPCGRYTKLVKPG